MTVARFVRNLDVLLRGDIAAARRAAQDIAGDLLILIEHVPWGTSELQRRTTTVACDLILLRSLVRFGVERDENRARPPE